MGSLWYHGHTIFVNQCLALSTACPVLLLLILPICREAQGTRHAELHRRKFRSPAQGGQVTRLVVSVSVNLDLDAFRYIRVYKARLMNVDSNLTDVMNRLVRFLGPTSSSSLQCQALQWIWMIGYVVRMFCMESGRTGGHPDRSWDVQDTCLHSMINFC